MKQYGQGAVVWYRLSYPGYMTTPDPVRNPGDEVPQVLLAHAVTFMKINTAKANDLVACTKYMVAKLFDPATPVHDPATMTMIDHAIILARNLTKVRD